MNKKPFTLKGYTIEIKHEDETKKIYVLDKKAFTNALEKSMLSFVDKDKYQLYLDNEQVEIKDTGSLIENVDLEDDITIKEVSIPEANCTTKAIIKNDKVDGVAYTCEAKGYAGPIKFQIGFANGEYHGYIDLANTESKVGIIPKLEAGVINGIDANEALLSNSTYKTAYAGTTVSAKGIAKAIEACRLDYIASLSAK